MGAGVSAANHIRLYSCQIGLLGERYKNVNHNELTRSMTLILIALAKGPKHGYAIMNAVREMTNYELHVPAGTLYRSLEELVERRLIEEAPELLDPDDDQRRKYYRLTSGGRLEVVEELRRMDRLVNAARKWILEPVTIEPL